MPEKQRVSEWVVIILFNLFLVLVKYRLLFRKTILMFQNMDVTKEIQQVRKTKDSYELTIAGITYEHFK